MREADRKRIAAGIRKIEQQTQSLTGSGPAHGGNNSETIVAVLTSQGSGGSNHKYAWTQHRLKDDGTTEAVPNGLTGTTSTNPAIQYSRAAVTAAPVLLRRHVIQVSGAAVVVWYVAGGAGGGVTLGTLQYQVYQMTSTTTAGWDWVRAHS